MIVEIWGNQFGYQTGQENGDGSRLCTRFPRYFQARKLQLCRLQAINEDPTYDHYWRGIFLLVFVLAILGINIFGPRKYIERPFPRPTQRKHCSWSRDPSPNTPKACCLTPLSFRLYTFLICRCICWLAPNIIHRLHPEHPPPTSWSSKTTQGMPA